MNAIKNSFFFHVLSLIVSLFKKSVTYKILKSVYKKISSWFCQSKTVSGFCAPMKDERLKNTLFGKIFYFPFFVLDALINKKTKALADSFKQTFLGRFLRSALHNTIAANSRYIALTVFSCALVFALCTRNLLNPLAIALMILSVLLFIFDFSLAKSFGECILNKLLKLFFAVELSFDWYDEKETGSKFRFIPALVIGIIAGFVWAKFSLFYAIGVVGAIIVLLRPEFAVGLTVFAMPILPTIACAALALLTFASVFLKKVKCEDKGWHFSYMEIAVMLFLLIHFICSVTSVTRVASLKISLLCIALASIYFSIRNGIKTKKQLSGVIISFIFSATAVALYGIFQYVFNIGAVENAWVDEEMFEEITRRAYSTLDNPNVLGEYLLMAIPVAAAYFLTCKKMLGKVGYLAATAILMVCLICTMSRGCWIAIFVAAAIFITFADGRYWLLGIVFVIALPFVLPESIINRFASIGDLGDSSSSYRMYIWLGTINMLRDYWFVGVGPGVEAFNFIYPRYAYSMVSAPHSHNIFLQVMAEMGFAGIFAFLALIFVYFRKIAHACRSLAKKASERIVLIAFGSGIAAFLIEGFFDNLFYNNRVFMTFFAVLAMSISLAYLSQKNTEDEK